VDNRPQGAKWVESCTLDRRALTYPRDRAIRGLLVATAAFTVGILAILSGNPVAGFLPLGFGVAGIFGALMMLAVHPTLFLDERGFSLEARFGPEKSATWQAYTSFKAVRALTSVKVVGVCNPGVGSRRAPSRLIGQPAKNTKSTENTDTIFGNGIGGLPAEALAILLNRYRDAYASHVGDH